MGKKELTLEEQKLQVRRKLLKLAVYGIPAISTILAAGKANADAVDEYYEEIDQDREEHQVSDTSVKTKRHRPGQPKKHKKGLS
ncbi:MAG: hypothetical protein KGJ87_11540 [Planctomycetota bacterium]|nr:hypothetical protein [Planctomycetota bacterium]MDE2217768.1 hypothetical protein [Planctomycetota bacterium]